MAPEDDTPHDYAYRKAPYVFYVTVYIISFGRSMTRGHQTHTSHTAQPNLP